MKKSSIETLLLLSNIQTKKELQQFCKDLRSLDMATIEGLLTRLETLREVTFKATADSFAQELEHERKKVDAEREQSKAAEEVVHLLMTRAKLKAPTAANQLSAKLAQRGYQVTFSGANKKDFTKWVQELCQQYPKEAILNASLDVIQ